jgi:hypothetical protein
MNFFTKLFRKQEVPFPQKEDSLLPRQICQSINDIAIDVFKHFNGQLLDKSASYVVQSVWGAEINGTDPTSLQIEINKKIEPVLHRICFKLDSPSPEQFRIIIFLLRELISTKLNYMIAATKKTIIEQRGMCLTEIEVIGNA